MSEQRKYIILSDGTAEYAVIFDRKLSHVDVANGIRRESAVSKWSKMLLPLEAVSAGFIYMPEAKVDPNTGSESLQLKPRPQDEAIIRGERVAVPAAEATPLPKPTRSLRERASDSRGRM